MRLPDFDEPNGFTLLEIVAVLALLSIFTMLAIVQHATSDASLAAQAQVLVSHIRYAQNRSMNSDTNWGIFYHHGATPADRYYVLYHGGNTNNTAVLPGQSDRRVPLGEMGIAIDSVSGAGVPTAQDVELSFDEWGSPQTVIAGSSSTDTLRLQLNKSGHTPQDIAVTKNTGFIP